MLQFAIGFIAGVVVGKFNPKIFEVLKSTFEKLRDKFTKPSAQEDSKE